MGAPAFHVLRQPTAAEHTTRLTLHNCWCWKQQQQMHVLSHCAALICVCNGAVPMLLQVLMCGGTTASGGTLHCTAQHRLAQQMPFACCLPPPVLASTQMKRGEKQVVGSLATASPDKQGVCKMASSFVVETKCSLLMHSGGCCGCSLAHCVCPIWPLPLLMVSCRLVELGNHAGLTALHYAVFCDQIEVMQQLLAADADITVQAEFPDLDWGSVNAGDTAMHIAANKGNIDSIQILLRAYVSAGASASSYRTQDATGMCVWVVEITLSLLHCTVGHLQLPVIMCGLLSVAWRCYAVSRSVLVALFACSLLLQVVHSTQHTHARPALA